MRRRLFTAISLFFAVLVWTQTAQAIEIWKLSDQLMQRFERSSPSEAKHLVGGYTMLVKLGSINGTIAKVMPISTVAVLYFNPNGQVLGWSSKTNTIEEGKWIVRHAPGTINSLCLFFPEGGGQGVCNMPSLLAGAPFAESTKGNPFNLRAEKPAPYHLGRFGISLKSIASKLGI